MENAYTGGRAFVAPLAGSEGRNTCENTSWREKEVAPLAGSEGRNYNLVQHVIKKLVAPLAGSEGRNIGA